MSETDYCKIVAFTEIGDEDSDRVEDEIQRRTDASSDTVPDEFEQRYTTSDIYELF